MQMTLQEAVIWDPHVVERREQNDGMAIRFGT